MDPILQILLSWQFILFGLAVAAVIYVIRIIVEYVFTAFKLDPKKQTWWSDLILPILPIFVGLVGALKFKSFPYPDGLTSHGDRIIFGLVAGLLSTLMYRVIKALLVQKITTAEQTLATVISPLPPNPALPAPPAPPVVPVVVAAPGDPVNPMMMENHNLPPRGQL